MVAVNEAVSLGLSLCRCIGLEDLLTLCRGGETISLLRLFHYFPYRNDIQPDHNTANCSDQSGEHPDPGARGGAEATAGGVGAGSDQDERISERGEGSISGSAVSSRDMLVWMFIRQNSVWCCIFVFHNVGLAISCQLLKKKHNISGRRKMDYFS